MSLIRKPAEAERESSFRRAAEATIASGRMVRDSGRELGGQARRSVGKIACFYLLVVHTVTTGERSFVNRELLKSPNFVAGSVLMFGVGMILSGTLALMPSMMQVLLNYPVFDAGWMMAPRGFGTMLAMFIVARLINKVDNRWFILVGFLLTAA